MSSKGWIGVDLDGTIAHYDGWKHETHIGAPIPKMVERVKRWLAEGWEVRIFTARMSHEEEEAEIVENAIAVWTLEHVGVALKATCVKDYSMVELWDDRAVGVETNTGEPLNPSTRGLS